jgi:molybdopterin adenylyltransferase
MDSDPSPGPLEGGSDLSSGDFCIFGVLTVSDRASAGIYKDESGPAILKFFEEAITNR